MSTEDERIKLLMRAALDDAFKLHFANLYKIWLTNPADMDAARLRAAKGVDTAIKTYRITVEAIDAWEG